jgi:hypothetical protein
MTDAADKPPSKESIAGGAHYHAVVASQKWKAFRDAVVADAKRTADERSARDRERLDDARYAETHGDQQKGN